MKMFTGTMAIGMLLSIVILIMGGSALGATDVTRYQIRGKVHLPPDHDRAFIANTRIVLDGGVFQGFLKEDGTFVINDIPSASYTLEVFNPYYQYMPMRVDVNRQFANNVRAFQADFIGLEHVIPVPYLREAGLEIPYVTRMNYFEVRKPWSIRDILFNPSLIMVFVMMGAMYMMPSKEKLEEMKRELQETDSSTTESK